MPAPLDGFLLAAGLGTRMGPLSRALPKPAWTLGGRPLLQWGAEDLRLGGFQRLACNAHHHAARIREAAAGLEVFEEPRLLGSAGGLRHAAGRVEGFLAVWNADAVARVPWGALRAAWAGRERELRWLLVPHPGGPWTPVWLDGEDRVLPRGQSGRGPYHFTGASLWSPSALALIPEGPCDLGPLLPNLDHRAVVVEAFPWREIGTPAALIEAAASLAPEAEGRLADMYVHPTARPAAGAKLTGCVLGPGAAPPAALEDAAALWFEEDGRQVRLALP
jgi:NDP-sugar pyrophosphorylase family protein